MHYIFLKGYDPYMEFIMLMILYNRSLNYHYYRVDILTILTLYPFIGFYKKL